MKHQPSNRLFSVVLAICLLMTVSIHEASAQPDTNASQSERYAPEKVALEALKLAALATKARNKGGSKTTVSADPCEPHCVILESLKLSGSISTGQLRFKLRGIVLGNHTRKVELFGPADRVKLVVEGKNSARPVVFIHKNTYTTLIPPGPISIEGKILLHQDRSLSLRGPINTVESSFDDGGVVEGDLLTGVEKTTIHLRRRTEEDPRQDQPALFQLSRALRFGRQNRFEYRLGLSSSRELNLFRFPLELGEGVTEVQGATGWRVEGDELLLFLEGSEAELTIRGTLGELNRLEPDPRSSSELWLVEAEPDQRLSVSGNGERLDISSSPIPATLHQARLYRLDRGQNLDISVESLEAAKVLSAIVREHRSNIVFSPQGDIVSTDLITYENKGLGYLPIETPGEPVFLATNGEAKRILREKNGENRITVPLQSGRHTIDVQTIRQTKFGRFGGLLPISTPVYPLTSGSQHLTLGLPQKIIPLALFGGERTIWSFHTEDIVVILLSLLVGFVIMRRKRGKLLACVSLIGLWFASPFYYFNLLVFGIGAAAFSIIRRHIARKWLVPATIGLVVLGLISIWFATTPASQAYSALDQAAPESRSSYLAASSAGFKGRVAFSSPAGRGARFGSSSPDLSKELLYWARQRAGQEQENEQALVSAGMTEGVLPVPLPPILYEREIVTTRQLITEDRPFEPTLLYLTWWGLSPLVLLWILSVFGLFWLYRKKISETLAEFFTHLKTLSTRKKSTAPEQ